MKYDANHAAIVRHGLEEFHDKYPHIHYDIIKDIVIESYIQGAFTGCRSLTESVEQRNEFHRVATKYLQDNV